MRVLLITLFSFLIVLKPHNELSLARSMRVPKIDLSAVVDKLKAIESNYTIDTVGDDGKALGILQIHKCVIDDVNRVFLTSYTHEDVLNECKAEQVFYYYMRITKRVIKNNEGRLPTEEDYVRSWNGGAYNGWKEISTKKYWDKYNNL